VSKKSYNCLQKSENVPVLWPRRTVVGRLEIYLGRFAERLSLLTGMVTSLWFRCRVCICVGLCAAGSLQHDTAAAALTLFEGQQSSTSSRFENIVDTLAAQAGAFQISLCANFSRDRLSIVFRDESHRLLAHFLNRNGVFSKILLQPNEDDRNTSAQSLSFFNPL
jgi:hypothetical protein